MAYVGSLGDGPPIPDVDIAAGDLAVGGELFRQQLRGVPQRVGRRRRAQLRPGGPVAHPGGAPRRSARGPLGPGQMPRFGTDTLTSEQLNSIARYVEYLRKPEDPGGLALGRIGPIPEASSSGSSASGLLLITVAWIGKRNVGNAASAAKRAQAPGTNP